MGENPVGLKQGLALNKGRNEQKDIQEEKEKTFLILKEKRGTVSRV